MNEVKREATDRIDQAISTVQRMIDEVSRRKGKPAAAEKERLLGLAEDLNYARSVLERASIPFVPNR